MTAPPISLNINLEASGVFENFGFKNKYMTRLAILPETPVFRINRISSFEDSSGPGASHMVMNLPERCDNKHTLILSQFAGDNIEDYLNKYVLPSIVHLFSYKLLNEGYSDCVTRILYDTESLNKLNEIEDFVKTLNEKLKHLIDFTADTFFNLGIENAEEIITKLKGEITWFLTKFKDFAEGNNWGGGKYLLWLYSLLGGWLDLPSKQITKIEIYLFDGDISKARGRLHLGQIARYIQLIQMPYLKDSSIICTPSSILILDAHAIGYTSNVQKLFRKHLVSPSKYLLAHHYDYGALWHENRKTGLAGIFIKIREPGYTTLMPPYLYKNTFAWMFSASEILFIKSETSDPDITKTFYYPKIQRSNRFDFEYGLDEYLLGLFFEPKFVKMTDGKFGRIGLDLKQYTDLKPITTYLFTNNWNEVRKPDNHSGQWINILQGYRYENAGYDLTGIIVSYVKFLYRVAFLLIKRYIDPSEFSYDTFCHYIQLYKTGVVTGVVPIVVSHPNELSLWDYIFGSLPDYPCIWSRLGNNIHIAYGPNYRHHIWQPEDMASIEELSTKLNDLILHGKHDILRKMLCLTQNIYSIIPNNYWNYTLPLRDGIKLSFYDVLNIDIRHFTEATGKCAKLEDIIGGQSDIKQINPRIYQLIDPFNVEATRPCLSGAEELGDVIDDSTDEPMGRGAASGGGGRRKQRTRKHRGKKRSTRKHRVKKRKQTKRKKPRKSIRKPKRRVKKRKQSRRRRRKR